MRWPTASELRRSWQLPANRTNTGQFTPGVSGNPSGRPKRDATLAELVRAVTGEGAEIVGFYWDVFTGQHDVVTDARYRMEAAAWLADRGWGKAPQAVELTGAGGEPLSVEHTFETEHLAEVVAVLHEAFNPPAEPAEGK